MKRLILIFLMLCGMVCADNWYVDSSVGVSGTGQTPGTAWKLIADITWGVGGVVAGDSLLFRMDQTWTEGLDIQASGTESERVTVGSYNAGSDTAKPLIDLRSATDLIAIKIDGVRDYITVENFQVKGSGGAGAVQGLNGCGKDGDGFTVTFQDIDVLENTGDGVTHTGSHDGFDLSQLGCQAIFNQITATKCRELVPAGGGHQGISFHDTCEGVINTAEFTDCNYAMVHVVDSVCVANNITTSGMLVKDFTCENNAITTINNSNITLSGTGAASFQPSDNSTLIINDSTITSPSSSSATLTTGTLNFNDCNIDQELGTMNLSPINGSAITLDRCVVTCGGAFNYFSGNDSASAGHFNLTNNTFNITTGLTLVKYANGVTSSKPVFKNNIVNGASNLSNRVLWVLATATGPDVEHNTVYNAASGGKFLDIDHASDQGGLKNVRIVDNIFHEVLDVVDLAAGGVLGVVDYNDYYNSEDMGGANSITGNPDFIDAPTDFGLQDGSPARDEASDGTNMGAVQDTVSAGNSFYGTKQSYYGGSE